MNHTDNSAATPPFQLTVTPYVPKPAPAPAPERAFVQFHSMSYFTNYSVPQDAMLVGDSHLTRGSITVIAGVPGCGKSRLLVSLAIAGSQGRGASWMNLPVHARFKTAILQAENGELRLKNELSDIAAQGHDLEDWLYITPPPPYGLAFNDPDFLEHLRQWLAQIQPGVLAIDPWNRCVMDDKAKDFRATLDAVQAALPEGPARPAIVIVHHLRKQPGGESRKRGRDLLPELSGSHVIGSACRAAFILEPASPDPDDDRVIFTCAKNNDGQMGAPSAWRRRNGLFEPCADFDWEEWNGGQRKGRRGVELEDLEEVFRDGEARLSRKEAVVALAERTGLKPAAVYRALQPGGRFDEVLEERQGRLCLRGDSVT
jgi:energy-coupling factor transporter ATP-binding protein EcfA2